MKMNHIKIPIWTITVKKMVDFVLNEETERMNKEAKNETPVIELRRYFAPVSAGTGVELEPLREF